MKLKQLLLLTLTALATHSVQAMRTNVEHKMVVADSLEESEDATVQADTKSAAEAIIFNKNTPQLVTADSFPINMGGPTIQLINEYLINYWDYPAHKWLDQQTITIVSGDPIDCATRLSENHIALGTRYNKIHIYDVKAQKIVSTVEHDNDVRGLAQMSDNIIASSSRDDTIKIWDITDKKKPICKATYPNWNTRGDMNCLLKASATKLAIMTYKCLYLMDIETGYYTQSVQIYPDNYARQITSFIKIADNLFASGWHELLKQEGGITFWTVTLTDEGFSVFTPCGTITESTGVTALGELSDNQLLVGLSNSEVHLWDITNLTAPRQVTSMPAPTTADPRYLGVRTLISIAPDIIACSFRDGTLSVWDLTNTDKPKNCSGYFGCRNECLLSITDNVFASFSGEGSAINLFQPNATKLQKLFNQPASTSKS
jgi:WD40 repeat protein